MLNLGRTMQHRTASRDTSLAAPTAPQHVLDFYAQPSGMTSAGRHAPVFQGLPNDVGELVRIIQGLAVYENVAADFYGFTIPDERKRETHLRSIEEMLDRLLALDARPLSVARPVDKRLVGRCHHFALLLVAMLRAKAVPARARGGFGAYFNPGYFEDHWVCEYWNAAEARWVLVDPQLDNVWRTTLKVDFDPLDVPRDRFVIAGDAWAQCRAGEANPSKFGIFFDHLRGLWFVAGDVVRDAAALNKMEMLPWDVWGAMPGPGEPLENGQLRAFDRLAALTRAPDAAFGELRALYEGDDRLRVPATVHNAQLNREETL
jgi:hypothetical protein